MNFAVFVQVGFLVLLCLGFSSASSVIIGPKVVEEPDHSLPPHEAAKTGGAGGPRLTGGGAGYGGWPWRLPVGGSYPVPTPGYEHPTYPPCAGGGGGGGGCGCGGRCPYLPGPPVISCPVGCVPASGQLHHWSQKRQVQQNLGAKSPKLTRVTLDGSSFGPQDVTHGAEAQNNAGINSPSRTAPYLITQNSNEPDWNSNQGPMYHKQSWPAHGLDSNVDHRISLGAQENPGIGPKKDGESKEGYNLKN